MSDEAFARRFYSDRAELVGLGVPLDSQRDEFTGEELYTLRSERYFLPPLELDDDELAALQTCLFLLEGRFAYAEPLRLALQNLALGRAGGVGDGTDGDRSQRRGARPRLHAGAPGPARQARGRRSRSSARFASPTGRSRRDDERERTINPYALLPENGTWYVIGHDLDDNVVKNFRVSRIRSEIRFATRRERDFRVPETLRRRGVPRPRRMAVRRHRGRGADRASRPTPPGGCSASTQGRATASRTASSSPSTRRSRCSPAGSCARTGRAVPLEPSPLRRLVTEGARAARRAHEGAPPTPAAERARAVARRRSASARPGRSRPSASASSSRCSPTCSPPAARSARR